MMAEMWAGRIHLTDEERKRYSNLAARRRNIQNDGGDPEAFGNAVKTLFDQIVNRQINENEG